MWIIDAVKVSVIGFVGAMFMLYCYLVYSFLGFVFYVIIFHGYFERQTSNSEQAWSHRCE